jgi:ubiquinone/menaquinone biosynthesis C-methylase UbiE
MTSPLKNLDYTEAYYTEHKDAGLDYLVYGFWHESYASMVTEITLQTDYASPVLVDVGCACGATLNAFKATGVYHKILGIDKSEHMVRLGRQHFGFTSEEIIAGSATSLPVANDSVTLIQSGQVLEHVPDAEVDRLFAEFYRVLLPGGRMFHNLAALRRGNPPDCHDSDPTHVNVKPVIYWADKFQEAGFLVDFESYDRFVRSSRGPGGEYPSFYMTYNDQWTTYTLIKPT